MDTFNMRRHLLILGKMEGVTSARKHEFYKEFNVLVINYSRN